MGATQIVSIGLRIFSIWLWWNAVETGILAYAVHHSLAPTSIVSFGIPAFFMFVGVLIWAAARPIARTIAAESESTRSSMLNEQGAVTAAIVLVGLWCVAVQGLDEFGQYLTTFAMLLISGQAKQLSSVAVNITGIVAFAKIAAGLILVARARRIALWIA